ncbi:MAG: pseudouridine synthase [Bacteroidota bacterium]
MIYKYYILYKPYGYLSQFTDEAGHPGLNQLIEIPRDVYAVGRLDHDSEGLLLLSSDKKLNIKLLDPVQQHYRTYWVLVDGLVSELALERLRKGVLISLSGSTYQTLPAKAVIMPEPELPERSVKVRVRKHIPTTWIELTLTEGKNRQVRRMTAMVGNPTLRLVRYAMEDINLGTMKPGDLLELDKDFIYKKLKLT